MSVDDVAVDGVSFSGKKSKMWMMCSSRTGCRRGHQKEGSKFCWTANREPMKRRKRKKVEESSLEDYQASIERREKFKQTKMPSIPLLLIVMPSISLLFLLSSSQLITRSPSNSYESKLLPSAILAADGQFILQQQSYLPFRPSSLFKQQHSSGHRIRPKYLADGIAPTLFEPRKRPHPQATNDSKPRRQNQNRPQIRYSQSLQIASPTRFIAAINEDRQDHRMPIKHTSIDNRHQHQSMDEDRWRGEKFEEKLNSTGQRMNSTMNELDVLDSTSSSTGELFASEAKRNELVRRLSSTMLLESLLRHPFPINKSPFPPLPSPVTLLPSLQGSNNNRNNQADRGQQSEQSVEQQPTRGQSFLEMSTSNQSISTSEHETDRNKMRASPLFAVGQSDVFNASSLNYLVEKLLSGVKLPQNVASVEESQRFRGSRPMQRKTLPPDERSTFPKNDSTGEITTLDKLIRDEYESRTRPMIEILDKRQNLSTVLLKDDTNSMLIDIQTTKALPLNHRIDEDYLTEATSRAGDSTTTHNPPDNQQAADQLEDATTSTSTAAPTTARAASTRTTATPVAEDSSLSGYSSSPDDQAIFSLEPKDESDNSWVNFDFEELDALDETSAEEDADETSTDDSRVANKTRAVQRKPGSTSTVGPATDTTKSQPNATRTADNWKHLYNVPPYIFTSLNADLARSPPKNQSRAAHPTELWGGTEDPQVASLGSTTSGTNSVATLEESPELSEGGGILLKASKGMTKLSSSGGGGGSSSKRSSDAASGPRGSLVFSDGANEAADRGRRNQTQIGAKASTRSGNNKKKSRDKLPPPTTAPPVAKKKAATIAIDDSSSSKQQRKESLLLNHLLSTMNPLSELDLRLNLKDSRAADGSNNLNAIDRYGTTEMSLLPVTARPRNPLEYNGYVGGADYLSTRDWSRPISTTQRQQSPATPASFGHLSSPTRRHYRGPHFPTTTTSTTPAPPTEPPSVPYNYYIHQPVTNAQSVPTMVIPTTDSPGEINTTEMSSSRLLPPSSSSKPTNSTTKKFSHQLSNNNNNMLPARNHTQQRGKKPNATSGDFVPISESESPSTLTSNQRTTPNSITSDQNWSATKMTNLQPSATEPTQRKPTKSIQIVSRHNLEANRSNSMQHDLRGEPPNLLLITSEEPASLYNIGDQQTPSTTTTTTTASDGHSDIWQKSTTGSRQRNKSSVNKLGVGDESSMGDTDRADEQRPRKPFHHSGSNRRRINNQASSNSTIRSNQIDSHSIDDDDDDGDGQLRPNGNEDVYGQQEKWPNSFVAGTTKSPKRLPASEGGRVILIGDHNRGKTRSNVSTAAIQSNSNGNGTQLMHLATGNMVPVRVNSSASLIPQLPNVVYFGDQLEDSENPLQQQTFNQQQPLDRQHLLQNSSQFHQQQRGPAMRKPPSVITTEGDPYQLISSNTVMATLPGLSTSAIDSAKSFTSPASSAKTTSKPQATDDYSASTVANNGSQAASPPTDGLAGIKTSSSQKTGNDRLAFILIGGSCALSVVCLVLAAMSMRCQDMCDDYRSLRNAERAALKLQRHRLKYTKNHQQINNRYGGGDNQALPAQINPELVAAAAAGNFHSNQNLSSLGLSNQCSRSAAVKCLNERPIQLVASLDGAGDQQASIWNSQQRQHLCGCQNCLQRTAAAGSNYPNSEQDKENFGAWMHSYLQQRQHNRQQQQHRHASASRPRPLFGVASSVGTFFPRRQGGQQQGFSGGSSDAQILIDSQPSCVATGAATTFDRQAQPTRSKSILAKNNTDCNSSSHLHSGCAAESVCHHQQRHHSNRACSHQHFGSQATSSEPSDSSLDELLVCNGDGGGAHHRQCRHQLKLSQVKSQAKSVLNNQHTHNHGHHNHHHNRSNHHHGHNQHRATASSSSASDSAQCTCSHSHSHSHSHSADQQPLLATTPAAAPKSGRGAAHKDQRQTKRDKQLIWSANRDRLI